MTGAAVGSDMAFICCGVVRACCQNGDMDVMQFLRVANVSTR